MPSTHAPPSALPVTSVMIVDDHPTVREAVSVAVEAEAGLALVGVAASADEAFAVLRSGTPDVAVVDISLGDAHGLDLVHGLRAERAQLEVVVFSMYDGAVYAERAFRAGALGYVCKSEPTSSVTDAIRAAASGEVYPARRHGRSSTARSAAETTGQDGLSWLTDREMAVFQLLGQGRSVDDIAERLHLSRKTVETYRRRSKEKLGLDSVAHLLQFAIRWTLAHGEPS